MLSNRSGFVIRALHGKCSKRTLASSPSSSFVTSRADIADGGRTRAVVLVLGFGGAKPRHIAKYAQLYNGKGCSIVAGTASNHGVFVDHGELDAFAKDAVQQVTELLREDDATKPNPSRQKETPVVMHIISNGGAFVARKIGGMLDSRRDCQRGSDDLELFATRLKLGCQVFNSAPCYNGPKSSFNVIKHLIPSPLISVPAAVMCSH